MFTFRLLILASLVHFTSASASALTSADQSGTSVPPYYGETFAKNYKNYGQLEIKQALAKIYNSFHIKKDNAFDVISDTCSTPAQNEAAQGTGTCYKQTQNKYADARAIVTTKLDLQQNSQGYFIWEIYCDRAFTEADFPAGQGPNPTNPPDSKIINIEHTWPQSLFSTSFSKELQKGDLHHLYPSDDQVNSQRGNHPFAEVAVETENTGCPTTSKLGNIDPSLQLPNKGDLYFEPPARHRGNVARSLFYFSVRYQMSLDPVQEYFLRKWNREDPIDQAERARHEKIFAIQGNRNPFIDFPDLADQIKDF